MQLLKNKLHWFGILLILLFPIIFIDQPKIILWVNSLRTPFLDFLFIKLSSLGNSFSVLFLLGVVLCWRFKCLSIYILAFIIQLFFVLLFKQGIYNGSLRPFLYFKSIGDLDLLNLVEGVKIRYVNTFPSGHTTSIFFLASYFALILKKSVPTFILAIVALLVGFSRVYLLQHFFIDVYFGILFGTFSSWLAYRIMDAKKRDWHDYRINIDIKKKNMFSVVKLES
jgi:membrane-associated phospholipid phosphatase